MVPTPIDVSSRTHAKKTSVNDALLRWSTCDATIVLANPNHLRCRMACGLQGGADDVRGAHQAGDARNLTPFHLERAKPPSTRRRCHRPLPRFSIGPVTSSRLSRSLGCLPSSAAHPPERIARNAPSALGVELLMAEAKQVLADCWVQPASTAQHLQRGFAAVPVRTEDRELVC